MALNSLRPELRVLGAMGVLLTDALGVGALDARSGRDGPRAVVSADKSLGAICDTLGPPSKCGTEQGTPGIRDA